MIICAVFRLVFGVKILLRHCKENKNQMTKDAMQRCEEITAIVRKVCCRSVAGRVS